MYGPKFDNHLERENGDENAIKEIIYESEKKPFRAFDVISLPATFEAVNKQISTSSLGSVLVYLITCLYRNVNPEEKYIDELKETMKDVDKSNEELYILSLCFKIVYMCHDEKEQESLFETLEQTYKQFYKNLDESGKNANIAHSYFLLFCYYSRRDGMALYSKKCASQAIQFMSLAKLMSESDKKNKHYQSALGVFCFEALLYYLNDPRDNEIEIYVLIGYLSNDQLIEISLELDIKILDSLRDGCNYSAYFELRELLDHVNSMPLLKILLQIQNLLVEIAEGKKDGSRFHVLLSEVSLRLQHSPSFFKFKVYNAIFAMCLRTYNEFTPICLMVGKQMLSNIEIEYLVNQQSRPVIVLEMLDSLIYSPDIYESFSLSSLSQRISNVSDVCDKYSTFWSLEIKKAYFGTMQMIYEKLGLEQKMLQYRKQYRETANLMVQQRIQQ